MTHQPLQRRPAMVSNRKIEDALATLILVYETEDLGMTERSSISACRDTLWEILDARAAEKVLR